jgi:hypothetical protein
MTGKLTTSPRDTNPPEKNLRKIGILKKTGVRYPYKRYSVQDLLLRQNIKSYYS